MRPSPNPLRAVQHGFACSSIQIQPRVGLRVAAALLGTAALLATSPASSKEELVDGIAAQVGSGIVLASEVDDITRPVLERMKGSDIPEAEILTLKKDALERLIEQRLIDDVVAQLELTASEPEINGAIENIAREAGLTTGQLAQSVAGYGMNFDDYRAKIKTEIERNKVLNTMVRSRVRVEDAELQETYAKRYSEQREGGTEVHVRHILIATGGPSMRDGETACRIAGEARKRIEAGAESFGEIAQKVSDANPQGGGDLGWIHDRDLAGWMRKEISQLNESNPLSPVIEMPFGCNILALAGMREFTPVTFEMARPELENELFRRKTEVEYSKWVEKLREQSYIERKGIYASSEPFFAPMGPQ
jgi:peptidyl-prolyl cis-trans isomerase SurA